MQQRQHSLGRKEPAIYTYEPKFNISDVADLLGIQKLSDGNSFGVVCPFCGDTQGKMNFRIMKDNEPSNTYHGYCCGQQGNMLTLYADLKGIYGQNRYKIAYREILVAVNRGEGEKNQQGYSGKINGKEEEPVSLRQRDSVYRRLLELLALSDLHRKKLMERGLTKEQIEVYQFCSTPAYGTENLARKLIKEGYSLAGVPGFFFNDRRNWDIAFYRANRGILCPAYSLGGEIAGFQIRMDEPLNDRKYLWLSSTNRNRGTGSRSPVTFLGNPWDKTIRVTEGILKATIAHSLSGYSFLGTPGVSQYKELRKALMTLKQNGLEEVQEYYDMDKYLDIRCFGDYKSSVCSCCARYSPGGDGADCERKQNKREQIRDGCGHLYEICDELALRCVRKTWDMTPEGIWAGKQKGIDDYWWACKKNISLERGLIRNGYE